MEAPLYFRRKTSAGRAYLQIVESRREGDQVRQQVIATRRSASRPRPDPHEVVVELRWPWQRLRHGVQSDTVICDPSGPPW
jgi:hypothetical protein